MRVFGRFSGAGTTSLTENVYEYVVECGVAEWLQMSTRERLRGSPIWASNQLEGMGWFLREYKHLGGRIVLEYKLV